MEYATPAKHFDQLALKSPTVYRGLAVFPICLTAKEFEKSDEVIEIPFSQKLEGEIIVSEADDFEVVNIKNGEKGRTLLLQGMEFDGGAQNRILLENVLLEKNEKVLAPVAGVEAKRCDCIISPSGKKYYPNENFYGIDLTPGILRRKVFFNSFQYIKKGLKTTADHKPIYDQANELFAMTEIDFKTRDMKGLYTFYTAAMEDYLSRYNARPLQIGIMAFLDMDAWFMDVFLNESLFQKAYKRLLRSYAMDAFVRRAKFGDASETKPMPDRDNAHDAYSQFLLSKLIPIAHQDKSNRSSFYFESNYSAGFAIKDNENLVYLSAFSNDKSRRKY